MKTSVRLILIFGVVVVASVAATGTAQAYGGPGSVITGIGALLAALAAIGAAVFGFFWFPLKRMVQKVREDTEEGRSSPGKVEGRSGR